MLQFGAPLIDDTRSVNYNRNTFIIQATGRQRRPKNGFGAFTHPTNSVPTIFLSINIVSKFDNVLSTSKNFFSSLMMKTLD
jgi:hypothetical protein